ncbi:MAG: RNA-binding protein [Bacteroidales bacterium]|nr:RNA-binding protein [Bacteroidales bacterium]
MNIFVGSLPFKIEEGDLQAIFEEYGEVTSVRIITDKFSGRSKGFGFIDMPNDEDAKKAIEHLNGAELEGRTIVVNESEERKPREGGSGGFNRGGGGGGFNRGGGGGGYNRDRGEGGFNRGGGSGNKRGGGHRSSY